MKITNVLNLPEGFVRAVSTERHNAKGCLSATTLLNGLKQIILTDNHWDELVDDASNRIWATFGTAVHALMEQEGEYDFTEETMSCEVQGIKITGKIDNYNMKSETITDYKTASVWKIKVGDFSDWKKQGLIYSWLLARNGFPITKCRFVALLKDHSKSEAARNHYYPQSPMYVYEFDVTRELLLEIEDFITHKVLAYQAAKTIPEDEIAECTPEERWQKPPKFAVMKPGRKSAVRVFDIEAEAKAFFQGLPGHFIQERPGEATRCNGYCVCRDFCSFYKALNYEPVAE